MQRTLLLLTSLAPLCARAQNAAYSFDLVVEAYSVLSNDVVCDFDQDGFDTISELDGETFTLFGEPFTISAANPLRIGDNGFVRIDDANTSVIIDGLFTFLQPVDSTAYTSYSITGASGQYVFTAQWHFYALTNGPAGNFAMWQIRLEQATGILEVRFGPNSGGGMIYTDATGPNCGVFHAPNSFSSCYAKVWAEGDASNPTIDTLPNFDFDALHNLPQAHRAYRFTPQGWGVGLGEHLSGPSLQAVLRGNLLDVRLPAGSVGGVLSLMDASGRSVRRVHVKDDREQLMLRDFPAGVYVLELTTDRGKSTARFVRP